MKPKSKVLIIAGSDSSGGAGIQGDIKTVTALGSYAMTAITAVTSQNTQGIKSIYSVPIKNIKTQIEMVLDDIGTDGVKIAPSVSEKICNSGAFALACQLGSTTCAQPMPGAELWV